MRNPAWWDADILFLVLIYNKYDKKINALPLGNVSYNKWYNFFLCRRNTSTLIFKTPRQNEPLEAEARFAFDRAFIPTHKFKYLPDPIVESVRNVTAFYPWVFKIFVDLCLMVFAGLVKLDLENSFSICHLNHLPTRQNIVKIYWHTFNLCCCWNGSMVSQSNTTMEN